MPSKYQIISELASQTARDITSKAERYTDFLVTAANNYKYSFKEQLLIHAQKPIRAQEALRSLLIEIPHTSCAMSLTTRTRTAVPVELSRFGKCVRSMKKP